MKGKQAAIITSTILRVISAILPMKNSNFWNIGLLLFLLTGMSVGCSKNSDSSKSCATFTKEELLQKNENCQKTTHIEIPHIPHITTSESPRHSRTTKEYPTQIPRKNTKRNLSNKPEIIENPSTFPFSRKYPLTNPTPLDNPITGESPFESPYQSRPPIMKPKGPNLGGVRTEPMPGK